MACVTSPITEGESSVYEKCGVTIISFEVLHEYPILVNEAMPKYLQVY